MKSPSLYPDLTGRADYYDLNGAASQGLLLPRASAVGLEEALSMNELDLITRARLLGYYSKQGFNIRSKSLPQSFKNHIYWMIANVPGSKFAGGSYLYVKPKHHPQFYEEVKQLWAEQMKRHPQNLQIKINAAMFAFLDDPPYCTEILRSVLSVSPTNLWALKLLNKLGVVKDLVYEIQKGPTDAEELASLCAFADKCYLDTVIFHGQRMTFDAVSNLEKVVSKCLYDINARAELMGFYKERWRVSNVLGFDPQCLNRLATHALWCIEFIPASKFVGNHIFFTIDHKTAPMEHSALCEAWERKVSEFANNKAVVSAALEFFAYSGNLKRENDLVRRLNAGRPKGSAVFKPYRDRYTKQPYFPDFPENPKNHMHDLEQVAQKCLPNHAASKPGPFDYAEWAAEVDLNGAHLEGIYHWVPASSIENLEDILDGSEHADIYSRAKIIGSYEKYYSHAEYLKKNPSELGFTREKQASYFKHMLWFIENEPECQFVGTFRLSKDQPEYRAVKSALLHQVSLHKGNLKVIVNIAAAFARCDETIAKRLAKSLMKSDPEWGVVILALLSEKAPEVKYNSNLKEHRFKPGRKDAELLKVAKKLDLHRQSLFGRELSSRAIWSNERALEHNPNDLVLRAELLEAYDSLDQYSINFNGPTPPVVPPLIKHNLWFIEKLPDYYLYSQSCSLNHPLGRDTDRYLGPHAILLNASKKQLLAYPSSLAVGLAMRHYFPLGLEKETIAVLRKLQKLYPANKTLSRDLEHLNSLITSSGQIRKQLKSLKSKK